ncbi:MAG: Hsp20/alpha crystallin family protein [Gaiellaceae bacterium]
MPAMRVVGTGHQLSERAHVRREPNEYVIELDVSDFSDDELSIEALGPCITVRGDQREAPGDEGKAFRIHERLEESFRLPDDADVERITVFHTHRALEIHAPRTTLEPRRLPILRVPHHLLNADAEPC